MYIWNMCTKDLRKKIVPSWKTLEEWFRQQRYLLGEARHYPRNFHNRNFFLQKTRLKSNMNTTTSPDGEVSIFKGRSDMTFISLTDTDSFIRHVRRGSRKVSKEALGRQKEGGGGVVYVIWPRSHDFWSRYIAISTLHSFFFTKKWDFNRS